MTYHEQARKHFLHAPPIFFQLSEEQLDEYGCGAGKTGDKFVPDTMYGLSVKVCCIIHDLDWAEACTINDIERANERFLINLIRYINGESTPGLKQLRRYRATTYYTAVEDIGKKIFENEGKQEGQTGKAELGHGNESILGD